MHTSPSVLVVTTQTWLQITRLTMRLAGYGCIVSVICPEESHLTHAPGIDAQYRFQLLRPLDSLREAIRASHADYIVPTDDSAVWFLHEIAGQSPEFRGLIERSLGDSRFFPTLRSRFQLLSLAHDLDIAVPRTDVIADAEELQPWCTAGAPAFVLKKDGTWGGGGVQIVNGVEQSRAAFHALATRTTMSDRVGKWLRNGDHSAFARVRCLEQPEITAQSFIPGVPANAMYACHQGRVLGEVQARVVVSVGETGPSIVIRLIEDPRISRAGRLLAGALELSGFFGLDFILDARSGEPVLLELNPRSTRLGHIAVPGQPDLAACLWAQWTGSPSPAAGDASLARNIGFYPEGEQWLQAATSRGACRSDVLPHEADMIASLVHDRPAVPGPLRKRLWSSLSGLKNALKEDTTPQPFHHQEPEKAASQSAGSRVERSRFRRAS